MVLTRSRRKLQEQQTFLAAKARYDENRRQLRLARLRKAGILKFKEGIPTTKPRSYINKSGFEVFVYKSMAEEYYHRVVNAPLSDEDEYGKDPPICYSSVGPARPLNARPLGKLPSHIIEALNDHYLQITHGLMDPKGDLYNNEDQPFEAVTDAVMDEKDFSVLIKINEQLEERTRKEQQRKSSKMETPSTSRVPPTPRPYSDQIMVHGEIIGLFVIYGNGQFTRAVCSRTREIFTAHVLPYWKAVKIIEVMGRLQIPADMTTYSADEMRLSEICVSKRTELIKSGDRYIIFNPMEKNTIHSYCQQRLDAITEKEAIAIFKRMVEIVRFCHSRKVLFRNYKTRNFYLNKTKNGDFILRPCFIQDMCCEEDDSDSQYTRRSVCVPFMAPEMLTSRTKPLHSRTTEVWGLGVLLYILLSGKYPFHEKNMHALFRAIRHKQPKWPLNFISSKSRHLVDMLMKKAAADRMSLEELWNELQGDFPNIRCRSNLVMKQHDLLIKMDLFKMYWESYKGRLLPKNVNPINEEFKACKKDIPLATAMAQKDMEKIKLTIRKHAERIDPVWRKLVISTRLSQINQVLVERAKRKAAEDNVPMKLPQVVVESNLSWELLLPAALYPPRKNYHPSHHPTDWFIFNVLRDAGQLRWPDMIRGDRIINYPFPKFTGKFRSRKFRNRVVFKKDPMEIYGKS